MICQYKCNWLDDTETLCGYAMPDSWFTCVGMHNCGIYLEQLKENNKMAGKIMIDGVGKDVEIITNEKGGKQSKSPMAMHLVDPRFLTEFARNKANELEYCDEGDNTCVDEEDVKYTAATELLNTLHNICKQV